MAEAVMAAPIKEDELEQARKTVEKVKLSEKQRDRLKSLTINEISHLKDSSENDLSELHDKYSMFGQDEIDQLIPKDIDMSKGGFNVSLRQMERAGNSEIADTMSTLSTSLHDLSSKSHFKTPSNPILLKIYNPLKNFLTRAQKTGAIVTKCMKEMERYQNDLASNVVEFKKNKEIAYKVVDVCNQNVVILTALADNTRETISKLEEQGADPDYIATMKSEVLVTMERRILDLMSIAQTYSQEIMSINILINTHRRMIEDLQRTETVSVSKFNAAVNIAAGISVQQNAFKVRKIVQESADQMEKENAESLKKSTEEILDASADIIGSVDTIKKTADTLLDTMKMIHTREAGMAETLHRKQKELKEVSDYIGDRLSQVETFSKQTDTVLNGESTDLSYLDEVSDKYADVDKKNTETEE